MVIHLRKKIILLKFTLLHTNRGYTHGDNLFGNINPTIIRDSTKAQKKILLCLGKCTCSLRINSKATKKKQYMNIVLN